VSLLRRNRAGKRAALKRKRARVINRAEKSETLVGYRIYENNDVIHKKCLFCMREVGVMHKKTAFLVHDFWKRCIQTNQEVEPERPNQARRSAIWSAIC
jgi:hypothetical protein